VQIAFVGGQNPMPMCAQGRGGRQKRAILELGRRYAEPLRRGSRGLADFAHEIRNGPLEACAPAVRR
jgi:hypothetical protein